MAPIVIQTAALPLILTLQGASNAITMKLSPKDRGGSINAAWHRLNGFAWHEESEWTGEHATGHLTTYPNEHLMEKKTRGQTYTFHKTLKSVLAPL
jgi:hypothetical protein